MFVLCIIGILRLWHTFTKSDGVAEYLSLAPAWQCPSPVTLVSIYRNMGSPNLKTTAYLKNKHKMRIQLAPARKHMPPPSWGRSLCPSLCVKIPDCTVACVKDLSILLSLHGIPTLCIFRPTILNVSTIPSNQLLASNQKKIPGWTILFFLWPVFCIFVLAFFLQFMVLTFFVQNLSSFLDFWWLLHLFDFRRRVCFFRVSLCVLVDFCILPMFCEFPCLSFRWICARFSSLFNDVCKISLHVLGFMFSSFHSLMLAWISGFSFHCSSGLLVSSVGRSWDFHCHSAKAESNPSLKWREMKCPIASQAKTSWVPKPSSPTSIGNTKRPSSHLSISGLESASKDHSYRMIAWKRF